MADYFKARSAAEADYAASLNKILRKFGEQGSSDKAFRSRGEVNFWERLMSEVSEVRDTSGARIFAF